MRIPPSKRPERQPVPDQALEHWGMMTQHSTEIRKKAREYRAEHGTEPVILLIAVDGPGPKRFLDAVLHAHPNLDRAHFERVERTAKAIGPAATPVMHVAVSKREALDFIERGSKPTAQHLATNSPPPGCVWVVATSKNGTALMYMEA